MLFFSPHAGYASTDADESNYSESSHRDSSDIDMISVDPLPGVALGVGEDESSISLIQTVCTSGELWLCVKNTPLTSMGSISIKTNLKIGCSKKGVEKSKLDCVRVY